MNIENNEFKKNTLPIIGKKLQSFTSLESSLIENKEHSEVLPKYEDLGIYTSGIKTHTNTKILNRLREIEKQNNIKIIYAAEVGSRAWGSNSNASDYDVRFVYVRPKGRIAEETKDFIQCGINNDLDMYGYDITKIQNMVKKSNYAPFEWFNSGEGYIQTPESKVLANIINNSYDMNLLAESYLKLTKENYKTLLKGDNISIKTYLIILKTLLMSEYIATNQKLPPLDYKELFESQLKKDTSLSLEKCLELLNAKKANSLKEQLIIPRDKELENIIEKRISALNSLLEVLPKKELSYNELDNLINIYTRNVTAELGTPISALEKIYDKICQKFPEDIEYRQKLANSAGLSPDDHVVLASIVGPNEFKANILEYSTTPEVYSPNAIIDEKTGKVRLKNVESCEFMANTHIHTQNSDGEYSVRQLLDAAAKYADRVAKSRKDKYFTIAITDHNTVNGCKEAIEILKENPSKYKNLRAVLGAEISSLESDQYIETSTKPTSVHLLTQCIDPYDVELEKVFNNIKDSGHNPNYISLGDFDKIKNILSTQNDCVVGFAHPIEGHSFKKYSIDEIFKRVSGLVDKFIETFKDKAVFIENYYPSYDEHITKNVGFKELVQKIKDYSELKGLISTGGLDTHKLSIFFR